uniref:Protein SON n=1 Tax=Parascaris univalens TaxID=6257 RepID=A0A915AIZ0_PARUN
MIVAGKGNICPQSALHIDLFKCASRVTGGMGHKLMQKMGWTPGEGLGKDRDGPLEPLTLDVKSDRKGLVSSDEIHSSKKSHGVVSMEVAGKHPVSMLMELCSKKHWSPPQFTCIESGPSNNRRFTWKAVVNGVEYEPIASSASKKTGKAQVCAVVLQSLGLMQNDEALW